MGTFLSQLVHVLTSNGRKIFVEINNTVMPLTLGNNMIVFLSVMLFNVVAVV